MAKRTGPPLPHQQGPQAASLGPGSCIPPSTCPKPFTRRCGRRPFGRGAKSMISSWRESYWRSGSAEGGIEGLKANTSERGADGSYGCPLRFADRSFSLPGAVLIPSPLS